MAANSNATAKWSLRSFDSSTATNETSQTKDSGNNREVLNSGTNSPRPLSDAEFKLVPGRFVDLGSASSCVAFAAWGEREWALRSCGFRVQLCCVDFSGSEFLSYQWFTGEDATRDIPVCCAFAPSLVPLQPPSSLHECRALGSTGAFAIAWARSGTNEVYVRVYEPEEPPLSSNGFCRDHRWVVVNHLPVSVETVTSLAFSPGGNHLIAGGTVGLQLWNLLLGNGEEVWTSLGEDNCPGGIAQVEFSSDGRLFASISPNSKMVRVWWRSESASHGGFAFLLLPHADIVKRICWRPRSTCSQQASAQSLLTQCASGTVRIWQESDLLEDFDLYSICELRCSPSALVSWVEYYANYEGMLWPPWGSVRKSEKQHDEDDQTKRNKVYSSKRTWGTLDRGHGHAWFGEAAYDNLESRLGSIPSSSNTRDWIICVEQNRVKIWEIEGLGEHARTAVRCTLWTQQELSLDEPLLNGLSFCRFLLPVCHEGRPIPKCDELYADNAPLNLRICAQTTSGSFSQISLQFKSENERIAELHSAYFPGHKTANVRFVCSNTYGDLATIDSTNRLVWWNEEFKPKRIIDLSERIEHASFMYNKDDGTQLIVLKGKEIIIYRLDSEMIMTFEAEKYRSFGKILGLSPLTQSFILVYEKGVVSIEQTQEYILKQLDGTIVCANLALNRTQLWMGLFDGRLEHIDIASFSEMNIELSSEPTQVTGDKSSGCWISRKILSAGVWIARILEHSISGRRLVVISSLACNDLKGALSEQEASQLSVVGLDEDVEGVADIDFHEFGMSGVYALAILTKKTGRVLIASKKRDRWMVVAASPVYPTLQEPINIAWLKGGKLAAFGGFGEVLVHSGWTSATTLPWTFTGSMGKEEHSVSAFKHFSQTKRANSISLLYSTNFGDEGAFNEAAGHITWLCAMQQFSLPSHHPLSILEDIRQGRLIRAGRVLQHLNRELEENEGRKGPIVISPCEFKPGDEKPKWSSIDASVSDEASASSAKASALFQQGPQTAAALFSSGPETAAALFQKSASSFSVKPVTRDEEVQSDWVEQLEQRLPSARIASLSSSDHLQLLSCIGLYRRLVNETVSGLDPAASRYALAVELMRMSARGVLSATSLKTAEVAWAVHSDAQTALLKMFTNSPDITWAECRALGVAFWVQTPSDLKELAERLAKTHFLKFDRDPFRCLLFYAALDKPRVASALFKAAKNEKVATLLAQDFSQERWRTAAAKNAFVLVERKRYDDAAAFFLFAGRPAEALRVLSRNLEDFQLALFVAKLIAINGNPENVKALEEFLRVIYLEVATALKDPWLCSMIYTHLGEHEKSIQCFSEAFFAEDPNESPPARAKRRERFSWLREVGYRDKPRPTSFDPVTVAFVQYLRQRHYMLKYIPLLTTLEQENTNRAAVYYIAEGLPRLAENLFHGDSEEVKDLILRARVSSIIPEIVIQKDPTRYSLEANMRQLVGDSLLELNLTRPYMLLMKDNSERVKEHVLQIMGIEIASSFRYLSYGGVSSSLVAARRLACYALVLDEYVENLPQPERDIASFAAYAGLVLSVTMLKQFEFLDTIYQLGRFESGKKFTNEVRQIACRIAQEYLDYEEVTVFARRKSDNDWALVLARIVLKLLIVEDLFEKGLFQSHSLSASEVSETAPEAKLLRAIGALVRRIRGDAHYSIDCLPDPGSASFATIVDPL